MRRRSFAWVVAVALGATGSQVAHWLSYAAVAGRGSDRAQLLSETGHGYLSYAPLVLALGTVAVLLALVSEARLGVARERGRSPRLWPFAAFAPLLFACQEHFERLLHDGAFPWSAATEPTFALGLTLQLPLALLAWLAARLLLHAARSLGLLLAPPRRASICTRGTTWALKQAAPVRRPALSVGCGTRGPPLV